MSALPADFCIHSRWILPMTVPEALLEEHSLVVKDGRILDILPRLEAERRYAPPLLIERSEHVLMPGLVGARTDALLSPPPDAAALATLVRGGVTCCASLSRDPATAARVAVQQGLRVVLGVPVTAQARAAQAGASCSTPAEQITQALRLRDVYKTHPLVSTAFAPDTDASLDDAVFERIATLADELDCPLLITLHATAAESARCIERHGARPMQRLKRLGLLTPALNAAHMLDANAHDLELALEGGISITLCPSSDLERAPGRVSGRDFAARRIRLGLGGDSQAQDANWDPWFDIKLLALLEDANVASESDLWSILATATSGGAAALGIDHETGSLQAGKWADLCCIDLGAPAARPLSSPLSRLCRAAGRDWVSDVWVAGRQLLSQGLFTRFTRK